jgi:hypothetical protein
MVVALVGQVAGGLLAELGRFGNVSVARVPAALVDELGSSVLDRPARPARTPKWQLTPLVPAIHGVLAIVTVLFAVVAAVSAS